MDLRPERTGATETWAAQTSGLAVDIRMAPPDDPYSLAVSSQLVGRCTAHAHGKNMSDLVSGAKADMASSLRYCVLDAGVAELRVLALSGGGNRQH